MAEALLRHRLQEAGVAATVSSAGLHPGGRPATGHGVATMATRGLDLGGHQSRQLERRLVDGADLVIGMAREHVREVAVVAPGALHRAFTLKELVRAAEAIGPRRPHESLAEWLDRVGAGRRREDLLGVGHDDDFDVADPVGGTRGDYERTADLLDDLLTRLVRMVWPEPAIDKERAS